MSAKAGSRFTNTAELRCKEHVGGVPAIEGENSILEQFPGLTKLAAKKLGHLNCPNYLKNTCSVLKVILGIVF